MTFWDGKVAVITGGGGGIGRASALLFVERGARVVIADLKEDGGHETVELAGGPEHAVFVRADTTSVDDVGRLMAAAVDAFGRIDVLHNNAAIIERFDRIEDEPVERFRRVIDINLNGLFICSKAAVPHLRAQGGVIVNMSSMGAVGAANILAYGSAKAGVLALTRGLSQQLAADGIRVNAIMPGLVETPMTAEGPAIARARREQLPVFQPEEMARAVAYAAEHEELNGAFLQYVPTAEGPRFAMMEPWTWEPLEL
ncbi:MAG: SDR family oxidoreductase [Chloroflexi bacterium]|nr:SDR family oxidoreductase [Chloroflexota bacterium]